MTQCHALGQRTLLAPWPLSPFLKIQPLGPSAGSPSPECDSLREAVPISDCLPPLSQPQDLETPAQGELALRSQSNPLRSALTFCLTR